MLRAVGHSVTVAADGMEVLALARELKPRLVICSISLPGLNGYELCNELKIHAETSDIPIVLLYPADDREARIHALNVGADAVCSSPIDSREFKAVIDRLLTEADFLASHEDRSAVTQTLIHVFEQLTGRELDAATVNRERDYRNKLLSLLGWNGELAFRTYTALALRSRLYKEGRLLVPPAQLQRILQNLRMGIWLFPLLLYKSGSDTSALEFEAEYLQELDVRQIGELTAVLERFLELLQQDADKEKALAQLQSEANARRHDRRILELLTQIVRDEIFLDNMT